MERLRQIAEHINGVLWLSDLGELGGTLLYVSPGYDAVWGRDRTMLRDQPEAWLDAVHPADRAEVEARFRRGAAQGAYDCEYRLVRPSGVVRWVHDRAFPIRDVEGTPRRIARLSQDVTAEKEAAMAAQMRELARRLQATREEERGRIARELHDELGQALTGIKLHLVAAGWNAGHADGDVARAIRTCVGEIEDATGAVRGMIHSLRPPMLDDLGLVAALRMQAVAFAQRTGIACELEALNVEPDLSDEEVTALFRIAQESLTNVARHAEATHVAVRLTVTEDWLRLTVEDDGQGMRESKGTHGLRGMSERAALLPGTLRVEPRSEGGTVVRLEIPRVGVGAEPSVSCSSV